MKIEQLPILLMLLPLGVIAWLISRVIRFGGLVGALLGARSKEMVGEVQSERASGVRQIFRVHVLETELGQGPMVGLQTTTYAWGSRKTMAARLSPAQARDLAALLTRAAGR
jgi:hypothetical protein